MIGKTISHYSIIEKLGEGGMGVVYKAEDTRLKRTVALKFLPPDLTRDPEAKQRFTHEAQAASALQHTNVCNIHDIDETSDGQLFMVMDCYEGESLKEKIASQPMRLEETLEIITQVASGLSKAHAKGIIHRDIKPANIFITSDGTVKILDFGLAKLIGSQTKLTKEGSTLGTVHYMSPEQARGEEVDARTDIWSLGVVLYEMVLGKLPFASEYEAAVVYSILNEEPTPLSSFRSDIPAELETIVKKMLAKNPNERYQNIDELLLDIQELQGPTKGISIQYLIRKFLIRKRRMVMVVAAGLLLLILTAIFLTTWISTPESITSIAVLPLENLSGNPDQDYLAAGLHEELIVDLSKLSGLKRVIARASVMRYNKTDKTLSEIGKELDVDALVSGSVVKLADRVHVTVQLIESASEKQLWADRYQNQIRDILTIRNEIVTAIARGIKLQLTPEEQSRLATAQEVNPDAFEAYLRGRFHWFRMTAQDLDIALRYFELARTIDPNCALAYAGIAEVWIVRQQHGFVPPSEAVPKIKAAANRALELDSTLADVHFLLANIQAWVEWDWYGADISARRAIALGPKDAEVHAYYSHLLQIFGEHEEAMVHSELARQLDPFSTLFHSLHGMNLMYEHRYDDAISLLNKILETSPKEPIALSTLRSAYHMKGRYKEALEIWKRSFAAKGDFQAEAAIGDGSSESDYQAALTRVAELLIARSDTAQVTPWQIATLYTRAGKKHQALDWLEKAFDYRDPNMPYISIDPIFDYLREESRFKVLLQKMKFPERKSN
jgi:serine/threonine protein kinase/Tfp pilus assembly protein PilF